MLYERQQPDGRVKVEFQTKGEVEAVSAAFTEHNNHLRSIGNDKSVRGYHEGVAKWIWYGKPLSYLTANTGQLLEKLHYYDETTEEQVDAILDKGNKRKQLKEAARRYRLGHLALQIAQNIEIHEEVNEVLGDQEAA